MTSCFVLACWSAANFKNQMNIMRPLFRLSFFQHVARRRCGQLLERTHMSVQR